MGSKVKRFCFDRFYLANYRKSARLNSRIEVFIFNFIKLGVAREDTQIVNFGRSTKREGVETPEPLSKKHFFHQRKKLIEKI